MNYYVYQQMPKPPRGSGTLRSHGKYPDQASAEAAMKEGRQAAKDRRDLVGTWSIGRAEQ